MLDLEDRRRAAIDGLISGQVRQNSWGAAVASYIIDHPEESEEMALHHYRSFLSKKTEMMVPDISTGRHANPITLHNLIRNSTRIIKAN